MKMRARAGFACLCIVACARSWPEPASVLPEDAGALIALAPSERIRTSLAPLLERLPEAVGVVDLLRSVVGVSLNDDAETRDNGLDPKRGLAIAIWDDAMLVVLPLYDEVRGLRRLRLRLARLGFATDEAGPREREHFVDRRGLRAALWTTPGLAFVCVGNILQCGEGSRGSGWDPQAVIEELANEDFVVVGVIRSPLLIKAAAFGLPLADPRWGVALIQDVRWAIGLNQRVFVRAAAGPSGPPVPPVSLGAPLKPGIAAEAQVALPRELMSLLSQHRSVAGAWGRWTGEAVVAVLDEGGTPAPLPGSVTEALRRLRWVMAARFRSPSDAFEVFRQMTTSPPPNGGAPALAQGRLPLGSHVGLDVAIRVESDIVIFGADAGRAAIPDTAPVFAARGAVFRLAADPGALLKAVGGGRLEFLGRMARSVQSVEATLAFQAGRLVLSAEARLQ